MKIKNKIKIHTRRETLQYFGNIAVSTSLYNIINYKIALAREVPSKKIIKEGIKKINGDVYINKNLLNPKNDLNQKIPINSIIKTGSLSSFLFVIDKDAFLLRENTTIKLNHHKKKKRIVGFEIYNGGILSVFSNKERRLRTPSALIGIKGTAVYLEVDIEKSYICTCYGTSLIQLKKDLNIKEIVKTNHHDEPRYIYSDKNIIEQAPIINHTDLELIMLEELVLRVPPFLDSKGTKKRKLYL